MTMPRPHATVDNDRQRILKTLAAAILNLGQAQKDLTECEPETLNQNRQANLRRLAGEIGRLASEFLRETPGT